MNPTFKIKLKQSTDELIDEQKIMILTRTKVLFLLISQKRIDEEFTTENFDKLICEFISDLEKSNLARDKKIGIVFLLLLAKYPTLNELLGYSRQDEFIIEVFLSVIASSEFSKPSNLHYNLVLASSEILYCDVTHSIDYPRNTGIQRVVRNLCMTLLQKNNHRIALFRVSKQRPILIDESEYWKLQLDGWTKINPNPPKPHKSRLQRIREKILHKIKRNRLLSYIFLHNKPQEAKMIDQVSVIVLNYTTVCLPEVAVDSRSTLFYPSVMNTFAVRLCMIVHDLIPFFYPEYCHEDLVRDFNGNYLVLMRYASLISCVSQDSVNSVKKFLNILPLIDLPIVHFHHLPITFSLNSPSISQKNSHMGKPKILCVATIEPRKNHIAFLQAAVNLWNANYEFELIIIGQCGYNGEHIISHFDKVISGGYDLKWLNHCSDIILDEQYQSCLFTIYVSHVEGFGLPILESLSYGKPCICSNLGSMKEIADLAGGCLLVNPNSVSEIEFQMKLLLTDADLYATLRMQALKLKWRTLDDYASELYQFFMNSHKPD